MKPSIPITGELLDEKENSCRIWSHRAEKEISIPDFVITRTVRFTDSPYIILWIQLWFAEKKELI